jgi:predicted nucleotidyltransferase
VATLSETVADPYGDPRGHLAAEVARRVQRRWRAEVLAIGVHGSLAHGDDRDGTDIDVIVVTYRPGTGPTSTLRRIDGHVVDLGVLSQAELLTQARALTTRWPLVADRYLHVRPLVDETNWLAGLRDAHLGRLAEATPREFTALARQAWCDAWSLMAKAIQYGQWHDQDSALLLLAEARAATAVTDGLLTRTYYRSSADAARRAGVAGLDLVELRDRLELQAAELAKRGRPVDGSLDDLLG